MTSLPRESGVASSATQRRSWLLPVVAVSVAAFTVGLTLTVAGTTHGYDFRAYYAAAVRVLDGGSAYDQGFTLAGAGGLFFYPPTFVPLVLPLALMPVEAATWAWTAMMLVAFALAVVSMPVAWRTRWLVVLLAGLSWPFVHNIKLGQVGPLLLLLFALAWRWRDRPVLFGVLGALGACLKVQPVLLLVWAAIRRQWLAVVAAIVTFGILAAIALLVTGPGAWSDFASVVTRVSDPIATPQNATPGAVAWQLGAPRELALQLQLASTIAVGVLLVAATLWLPSDCSLMVAIVATQLVSPVLWDHYAIVLLLPTAWLIDRGRAWAALIPLATPIILVGLEPVVVYPLLFAITLVVVCVEGYRSRDHEIPMLAGEPAHA